MTYVQANNLKNQLRRQGVNAVIALATNSYNPYGQCIPATHSGPVQTFTVTVVR